MGAVSGDTVYSGTILTCHVTSFPPANYSWTDLKYGNSSSGSRLAVWHDGSYKCTASNYFNGQWHTASKSISNLRVDSKSVGTCSSIGCKALMHINKAKMSYLNTLYVLNVCEFLSRTLLSHYVVNLPSGLAARRL